MNVSNGNQMCVVFRVEIVHIGDVLEIVSVNFAAFQSRVGNDVIGEFLNLQIIALFSQCVFKSVQNFHMRRGAGANHNRD